MANKWDPEEFQKDVQYRQLHGADRSPVGRRKGKFWWILVLLIIAVLLIAMFKPEFLRSIGN